MVRSLDVQQIFLQSNAIERVQQVQQQQTDVQQKHFQGQLAEERKVLMKKVKDLEETEQLMIKKKEDQDKREKKKNRPNREKKKDDDDDLSIDESVGRIDIRV